MVGAVFIFVGPVVRSVVGAITILVRSVVGAILVFVCAPAVVALHGVAGGVDFYLDAGHDELPRQRRILFLEPLNQRDRPLPTERKPFIVIICY